MRETANNIGAEQPAHPRSLISALTLSKSSNWSSLQTGHPLYLIVAKSMKDVILKVCIFYSKALLTRLPDERLLYFCSNHLTSLLINLVKQR